MADPRNRLQQKFEEEHRFANFGDIIIRMRVKGFRCHVDTIVEIQSPVTAFAGLNGTGKSTLIQLAAAAYKDPSAQHNFTIRDFMVRSALDREPYRSEASVQFDYWTDQRRTRPLTLSRNSDDTRWNGYARRPHRKAFFAGIGLYLPKFEVRDMPVRYATSYSVLSTSSVPDEIKNWTCRILGHSYDALVSNKIGHDPSYPWAEVISATRRGCTYSETHMGFGEGRAQFMIHKLESLPDKSLVLLEEPETSLHQEAQHKFGQYLVDVAARKGHQVLLTTHSEYLLSALPQVSRKFLYDDDAGIRQLSGLSATQTNSLLTGAFDKALTILVEDIVGQSVLTEIIRRHDPVFLKCVAIVPAGDKNKIAEAVRALHGTVVTIAAVRDGDKEGSPRENIYKLPGARPPEIEILSCNAVVEFVRSYYGINLDDFLAVNHNSSGQLEHHQLLKELAKEVSENECSLLWKMARVYVLNLMESETGSLVDLLKAAIGR